MRPLAAVSVLVALAACSQLNFLKPATVPHARGASDTDRGPAYGASEAPRAADSAADWATYNRTFHGDRFAPQDEITPANVSRLTPVCTYELGEHASFQSGLVVIAGTLYFTTAEWTHAIDAASCALRWKHRYEYDPRPDFDLRVNRGVAYADGRIFRGANDGRVYALDADTGEELWNVRAADPEKGETFPAAPIAWDGLVFIGNAGGDNFGVVGRMMAFDQVTGGRVWSTDLVAGAGEEGRTWPPSTEVVPRTGGATWTSYTLDTVSGTLYVPTGNAGPDFLPDVREGANLYTTSVVELDARLGTLLRWHQLLERDAHDWDVSAAPLLVTGRSGRRLLVAAGKDGWIHAIERGTARRLWRAAVTRMENVDAPITEAGTRFCPGVNGGVEWNGPSFSPRTNLLYVNAIDWCTTVEAVPVEKLEGKKGLPWTGSAKLREPFGKQDSTRSGWLTALEADSGTVRWRYHASTPLVAGITATAGGLVFTGDLLGNLYAFDAADGDILFRHDTRRPIGGGIVSYLSGGRQYIAVAAGLHSPTTWRLSSPPAAVIVYGLSK